MDRGWGEGLSPLREGLRPMKDFGLTDWLTAKCQLLSEERIWGLERGTGKRGWGEVLWRGAVERCCGEGLGRGAEPTEGRTMGGGTELVRNGA